MWLFLLFKICTPKHAGLVAFFLAKNQTIIIIFFNITQISIFNVDKTGNGKRKSEERSICMITFIPRINYELIRLNFNAKQELIWWKTNSFLNNWASLDAKL